MDESEFNTMEIRNILVLIYLVSSLKYYKMEVDDKNTEIENLKGELKGVGGREVTTKQSQYWKLLQDRKIEWDRKR